MDRTVIWFSNAECVTGFAPSWPETDCLLGHQPSQATGCSIRWRRQAITVKRRRKKQCESSERRQEKATTLFLSKDEEGNMSYKKPMSLLFQTSVMPTLQLYLTNRSKNYCISPVLEKSITRTRRDACSAFLKKATAQYGIQMAVWHTRLRRF